MIIIIIICKFGNKYLPYRNLCFGIFNGKEGWCISSQVDGFRWKSFFDSRDVFGERFSVILEIGAPHAYCSHTVGCGTAQPERYW